jgi:DnaJ-domain-containing protein 1
LRDVPSPDPYATLGITSQASDEEVRRAYRGLAMTHHPDHNAGSAQSAVRFAEIQEAYAHVRLLRRTAARPAVGTGDAALEARIAEMEQELARARELRERATRRAERLARVRRSPPPAPTRPSDEELGYFSTTDSFTKILDDFAEQVSDARPAPTGNAPRPKPRSLSDWIDELGARLTGEDRER